MGNFNADEKKDLQAKIVKVCTQTEMGGNSAKAYEFSYAGRGKSSYSFGLLQFDVGGRGEAKQFLKDNGFTDDEIGRLSKNEKIDDLASLNKKLAGISAKVDQFTTDSAAGAAEKIDQVISYVEKRNEKIGKLIKEDKSVQLALADFDNQFNIGGLGSSTPNDKSMLAYLCGMEVNLTGGKIKLGDTISVSDIQNFIDRSTYASKPGTKPGIETRRKALEKALNDLVPKETEPTRVKLYQLP